MRIIVGICMIWAAGWAAAAVGPSEFGASGVLFVKGKSLYVRTDFHPDPFVLDISRFQKDSLKALVMLQNQPAFIQGRIKGAAITPTADGLLNLTFVSERGVRVDVDAQKVTLTAPPSLLVRFEYPMVILPGRNRNLRPVSLEGPLVDKGWLRSFASEHNSQDGTSIRMTGRFTSGNAFEVFTMDAFSSRRLMAGHLIEFSEAFYALAPLEGQSEPAALISKTTSAALESFNNQEVVIDATPVRTKHHSYYVIGSKGRIQKAQDYACELRVFF